MYFLDSGLRLTSDQKGKKGKAAGVNVSSMVVGGHVDLRDLRTKQVVLCSLTASESDSLDQGGSNP
jgi:hypothetical protein